RQGIRITRSMNEIFKRCSGWVKNDNPHTQGRDPNFSVRRDCHVAQPFGAAGTLDRRVWKKYLNAAPRGINPIETVERTGVNIIGCINFYGGNDITWQLAFSYAGE